MYTGDTSLMLASNGIEHTMYQIIYCCNHNLSNVYEWLSANYYIQLTLNMTKSKFILIASKQELTQFLESPSLTINKNVVEQLVTSTKSLGVYIDHNLKKIICAIGAIKQIRHLITFNNKYVT